MDDELGRAKARVARDLPRSRLVATILRISKQKDWIEQKVVQKLIGLLAMRRHDLARDLGVPYATLYAWESGRRRPRPLQMERLIEAAERRIQELEGAVRELRSRGDPALPRTGPDRG